MSETMRGTVPLFLTALLAACSAFARVDVFDVPLQKKVVDLGKSEYNAGRVRLSCYFYPAFVIKELVDDGLKGTDVSIAPVVNGVAPACRATHEPAERQIPMPFPGGFWGVKGNMVFSAGWDGLNGHEFAVHDSRSGTVLFHDSSLRGELRAITIRDGQVTLQYRRVVLIDCDLHTGNPTCWNQVRNDLGLHLERAPACEGYPSLLTYLVEVSLFPKPAIRPLAGRVTCEAQG